MITTTGSIFGAYTLFLPLCASRVKKYLKSIKSSYDKDDGLIPGGEPQEDMKLQPRANGALFEPGSL